MTMLKDKNSELIAKRWAEALMELACEDNNISKEEILDDLYEIANTINTSEELSNVICNPSITSDEKQAVLSKLFQYNILPIVYNFLFVLNLRKRVDIIELIAIEFEKVLEKYKNTTRVEIISAIEISKEKKEDIVDKLTQKLNKNIIADWGINKDIIAGLIFKIGETIIDNSVKHKLEDLSKEMMKG